MSGSYQLLLEFSKAASYTLEQELADYGLWTKSDLPPAYVNKVLLEHTHLFMCFLQLVCTSKAELSTVVSSYQPRHISQVPPGVPKTPGSTAPSIYYVFTDPYIPIIKFNL